MFIEIPASNKSIGQRKLVFGIGINDAKYTTTLKDGNGKRLLCPYYEKWSSMMRRCYSSYAQKIRPTYKDCFVCNEWLIFSNFKSWMKKQDWKGLELDKDILFKGNKEYSPSTCLFVTPEVNSSMCFDKSKRTGLPSGISLVGKRYTARCVVGDKRIFVGSFASIDEAEIEYNRVKLDNIKEIASRQSKKVRDAMLRFILQG